MSGKNKRLTALVVICIFLLALLPTASLAQDSIKVDINGKNIFMGSRQPYLSGGVLMVPLRAVSEALGANVSWDGSTRNITVIRGDNVAVMRQISSALYINGRLFKLSRESAVKNDSTYVPLDFIQTVFGYQASFDANANQLSIKIKVLPVYYSDSFRVEYLDNGCKLVTDGEGMRILLVPRGKDVPKGVKADKVVNFPVKNVMAASTTQVGPMIKLGVLSSLKAVTTPAEEWNTHAVKKAMEQGLVKYVGGSGMGQPDYEKIKVINPDIVFAYTGPYGQQDIIEKLNEIGINSAVNNEYLEAHYLGRMEWIKFMGAFFDKELEAEKIFNDAIKEIDLISSKVLGLREPKVAWGSSYKGIMYIPNAGSYVGKWIDMAGGDYVFKHVGVGKSFSAALSMEEFYVKAKDADILVYSSAVNYMQNPTVKGIVEENPLLADLKAVKNGNVWVYSADWWETIPEADRFIKDIAAVFHPEAFKGYSPSKLVKLPAK